MTIHTPHPDTHRFGLQDDCPRCAEHAVDPVLTLDDSNLARIVRLAIDRERRSTRLTHTDLVAATAVLNILERVGHLSRVAPDELCTFLERYGTYFAPVARPLAG
jgi:hypothetical protein